jgi:hypothetical protein
MGKIKRFCGYRSPFGREAEKRYIYRLFLMVFHGRNEGSAIVRGLERGCALRYYLIMIGSSIFHQYRGTPR